MSSSAETLIVLLTDVEGSTPLWQRHGQDMLPALDQLDSIVARVISTAGGSLDPTRGEGDSHFALFRLASAATRAAAEIQRQLASADWHAESP